MPDEIRVDEELGIIEVRSYGEVSKEDIAKSIAEVRHIFATKGIDKIFVDTTKQENMPGTVQIYDLFRSFPREFKLALLMQEPQATERDIAFAETVASNRGAQVKIFYEKERALAWFAC